MSTYQSSKPSEKITERSGSTYDDPPTAETTSVGSGVSLDLGLAAGPEPQPYAFLMQRPLSPPHEAESTPLGNVNVVVRAFDAQGNSVPEASMLDEWDPTWTWDTTTSDNEIRHACMGRWFTQAACNNGLTAFRVTNAEGQQFNQQLSVGQQTLSGHFMMQGFRVETIKAIAINWASTPPDSWPVKGLPWFVDFSLVGTQPPTTGLDRLHLSVHCNGGIHISQFYHPRINLHVMLLNHP